MSFNSYSEFREAVASEKISLVLFYPRQSVTTFTNVSEYIWKVTVNHVVNSLFNGSTELTSKTDSSVTSSNPWFYDITTNELFYYTESDSPDDDNIIAEYLLHFSNAPINLSYNLSDYEKEVCYEPRVLKTVGFKSQIGNDQKGISVTGSGTVSFDNNDGYFDSIFDSFIWENKRVEIYSYNRDLLPSEAQLQFKGYVVNKAYNLDKVSFKIQDAIFKLDTKVPMDLLTLSDGVGASYVGNVKRQVYGKVDGLLVRSIDQVGDGYQLTGTVSGSATSTTLTGSGTSFLSELAMNDYITINGVDYTVQSITSDTSLTISDTDGLSSTFSGEEIYSVPSVDNPEFNRSFFVADHAISQQNTTITLMPQLNRFEVADIEGFEVGDTIKIDGDPFTIFNISGNQIQININADDLYPVGTTVTKEPITQVFINGKQISLADLSSVSNTTECTFTLSNTAEFNLASNQLIDDANFSFTNGSRTVSYSGSADLTNIFQERDWIKAELEADTVFMRIVDISGTNINCAEVYTGSTGSSKKAIKRRPDYISDTSSVSINCLGRTQDGTSTGSLLATGADIVKQLLTDIGLENELDTASFTAAALVNDMRMSFALPYDIDSPAPKIVDVINNINQTVFGSLSLKQNFTLAYNIIDPERDSDIRVVNEDDIIKWTMEGSQTNSYKRVLGRYKFIDYDNSRKEAGNSLIEFTSSRVSNFDISNKEVSIDLHVYKEADAQELSERFTHFNEQTLLSIKIISDLRLSDIEIGDTVLLNLGRYMNSPTTSSAKRVLKVTGIKKDYNEVEIIASDLGNLYNRSAVVTDNSANSYSSATTDEKAFNSYITDDNGLITGSDSSKGSNLIS